jgi:hypothetical protein
MKRAGIISLISIFLCSLYVTAVYADDFQGSRLVPENKIVIYQDGSKIGEFTKEAPCPKDLFLSCEGKCGIKLKNISLVAEDKSVFAIAATEDSQYLKVKKGILHFGLSELPKNLVFVTPKGAVSANQMLLNASTNNKILEGYVKVTDDSSEVGVIEGGYLHMLTQNGDKLVTPGNRLILAQADIGADTGGTPADQTGVNKNLTKGRIAAYAAGVVATGGIVWGLVELCDDDDHHHHRPASPSTP